MSYIDPGPSGIWGHYTPNDHMLFELVSWITVNLAGDHSAQTYRIWGVLPALAATGLLTVWSWWRFGPWTAAIFAVLAVTSPLSMSLSVQARGYGLGFLASALILIGADAVARGSSRRALVLFGAGGLIGVLTLPTFVFPFVGTAALLCLRPSLRRPVVVTVGLVGLASLVFYAPVLGPLVNSAKALNSGTLPWHGFITGPFGDLLAPSVNLLLPQVSFRADEVIAAGIVLTAFALLWRERERLLALLLVVPAPLTYLAFQVIHLTSADRFMSFLMLPLLLVGAVGLSRVGTLIATRERALAAVAVGAGLLFSVIALRQGESQFQSQSGSRLPIEDWRQAAMLARPEPVIVTNSRNFENLQFYLGKSPTAILDAARLETTICSSPGPFAYVEHSEPPAPQVPTDCLPRRGAVSIPLNQLRGSLTVWLVPPS